MAAGNLAAKDHRDLVGLADGPICVQQPLAQGIQRCPAVEDQIVAVFNLSEEQPVLAPGLLPFEGLKEGSECGQPFLSAGQQIARRK
jgi:hypothetical protein